MKSSSEIRSSIASVASAQDDHKFKPSSSLVGKTNGFRGVIRHRDHEARVQGKSTLTSPDSIHFSLQPHPRKSLGNRCNWSKERGQLSIVKQSQAKPSIAKHCTTTLIRESTRRPANTSAVWQHLLTACSLSKPLPSPSLSSGKNLRDTDRTTHISENKTKQRNESTNTKMWNQSKERPYSQSCWNSIPRPPITTKQNTLSKAQKPLKKSIIRSIKRIAVRRLVHSRFTSSRPFRLTPCCGERTSRFTSSRCCRSYAAMGLGVSFGVLALSAIF